MIDELGNVKTAVPFVKINTAGNIQWQGLLNMTYRNNV